jgi:hypothetical protein
MWKPTIRTGRRTTLTAVALNLLLALPLGGAAHADGACPGTSSGTTCTMAFAYTGAAQTWTVPSGVTSATFDVFGAQGCCNSGGLGGEATATIAVTPAQILQINVGGQGGILPTINGAYNGGGGVDGGAGMGNGGGGATDVRSGGYTLNDRMIVAGGGGGEGAVCASYGPECTNPNVNSSLAGGAGGGTTGGDGSTAIGLASITLNAEGSPVVTSTGGSQTAGGSSGNVDLPAPAEAPGQLGLGANFNLGPEMVGGGGGGYYGGGAGDEEHILDGRLSGGSGGGGSGFGPTGVAFKSGVRAGNGQVIITYSTSSSTPTPTPKPSSLSPTPTSSPPSNRSNGLRTDLAGKRIEAAGGTAIYLVDDDGTKRYVPDVTTYNNLFRDWSGIQTLDVSTIRSGPDLTIGAYLAASSNAAGTPIYLVTNGQKRHITSGAVMDKFYLNGNAVQTVPQTTLDSLPNGPDLT